MLWSDSNFSKIPADTAKATMHTTKAMLRLRTATFRWRNCSSGRSSRERRDFFFAAGTVGKIPQDESQVSFAPMLDKSMCPIDWTKTAQQVHDHVRGLHPWPVATANIGGTCFKIHSTVIVEGKGQPGQVLELTKTGLKVACGEGAVEIRVLQAEGGKRMTAPDYFRGHPLET